MFGPDWTGGCPGCSFLVDHLDGIVVHLNQQDAVVACISHAPIEKLRAYKQRMGWSIAFISSFRNDLNFDFGVSFDKERGSAEYNFQKVDFDEVLKQFEGSDAVAEAAASCGIDLVEYVTTASGSSRSTSCSTGRRKVATIRSPRAVTTSTKVLSRLPQLRGSPREAARALRSGDACAAARHRARPLRRQKRLPEGRQRDSHR